jgi:Uma2 family endonuclease
MPGSDEMRTSDRVKLTYDDFLLFPDDGQRHELIDGEHFVTPSPSTPHQRIVGNLHFALRRYLVEQPIGEVFLAPFDVVF